MREILALLERAAISLKMQTLKPVSLQATTLPLATGAFNQPTIKQIGIKMRSAKTMIPIMIGSSFGEPDEGPGLIFNNQYKNRNSGKNRLSQKKRRIRARQMASVK